MVTAESPDRHNQKRRTRKDLLQAAARLITVSNSMLDDLLGLIR